MLECSWLNERTDLNDVVGTIMINQQLCSCMIEHVAVKEWWNSKIEQRCYKIHERSCCINSGFACPHIREQSMWIRQVRIEFVETWLNNTVILPIRSCSIMLTVTWLLSQQAFLTGLSVFRNQRMYTFESLNLLLKIIDILGENWD